MVLSEDLSMLKADGACSGLNIVIVFDVSLKFDFGHFYMFSALKETVQSCIIFCCNV